LCLLLCGSRVQVHGVIGCRLICLAGLAALLNCLVSKLINCLQGEAPQQAA
jgi:hypothetical protein